MTTEPTTGSDSPDDATDADDVADDVVAAGVPASDAPAAPGSPASPAGAVAPSAAVAPAVPVVEPRAAPKHLRCFLAVNLPVVTTRRIADEIEAIKGKVAAAGVEARWVPAANLHVTLKFLGPIRPEAAEAIRSRLERGLPSLAPFDIEARGLGVFPSEGKPRVIWVGLGAQPALIALQQAVEAWMAELGFAREERAFHPHVTVARVTGGSGPTPALATLLGERRDVRYGGGRIGEVVIDESRTLGKGAEYRPLGRVALGS